MRIQSGTESIFGDTEAGVPSPLVPHVHPYPTRYHGPIFNQPMFGRPFAPNPYALAPYSGFGDAASDQIKGALRTALHADDAAGARGVVLNSEVEESFLDKLTDEWTRGDRLGLTHDAEYLRSGGYKFTAQAVDSRLAQLPPATGITFNPSNSWLGTKGWWALSTASLAASAYHGYKRNESIGWAAWWAFMGGVFPVVTPAIALAQGFGKRKAKK